MVKTFILFTSFLFIAFYGFTQSTSSSIIAPAGGFDKTDKIQLDWTLGEIATETSTISNGLLTQGFHQPLIISPANFIKALPVPLLAGYTIKINPNPVQAILNISLQSINDSKVNLRLSDMNGKAIYNTSTNSKGSSVTIDMHQLAAGVYFLYITNSVGSLINTYKIVKTS